MNKYKIGVWGNFGQMHGLFFCEVSFFVYFVIKRIADHALRRYLSARARLRLWLPKGR